MWYIVEEEYKLRLIMILQHRPRRLRKNPQIRALSTENHLCINDLVYPIFITDKDSEPIATMPYIHRLSIDDAITQISALYIRGVMGFAVFPVTAADKKCNMGLESLNANNIINTALRAIKKSVPEPIVFVDVALDPYTTHGHDGVLDNTGYINNDKTIDILVQQAVLQAQNGADVICPSDMMDGRIGAIRSELDNAGFVNTAIMSYAAKYASAFYGPFRDAVGSSGVLKGDKKTYQMNPANIREAKREIALDINEGADMVMIKPGMPYLDIVAQAKSMTHIPVCVYQVSGEYSMIQNMIDMGQMDDSAILESLIAFKRAGADIIFSYFTPKVLDMIK